MGIGIASRCKVNANIGNSAITSNIDEELRKLPFGPVRRRHGDGPLDRRRHSEIRDAIIGTRRCRSGRCRSTRRYRVKRPQDLNIDVYLEVIEEQAKQGVDYFTIHAGVLIQYLPLVAKRITGIVSRGGAIMAQWMTSHHKQNSCTSTSTTSRRFGEVRRELSRSATACGPDAWRTRATRRSSRS